MKLKVELEFVVPEDACFIPHRGISNDTQCMYLDWLSLPNRCKLFGDRIYDNKPCGKCMEARTKAEK